MTDKRAINVRMRLLWKLSVWILAAVALCVGCSKKKGIVSKPTSMPSVSIDAVAEDQRPRVLGKLPDFSLTDQSGSQVGLADLRGHVWVANFIFTRCQTTCPKQTATLAQLQSKIGKDSSWADIRFVSFTVDPEFDTPEILSQYAGRYGADLTHWRFLTGSREAIWVLSKEGFKLPVGKAPESAKMPIFHSSQLILIDRLGQIRGYFDSSNPSEVKQLAKDLKAVATRRRQTGQTDPNRESSNEAPNPTSL